MFNYSATIQQKRKKCGGRPRNGNKILRFYEKIQIRTDFKEILEDFRFFIFENSYFRTRGHPIIAVVLGPIRLVQFLRYFIIS